MATPDPVLVSDIVALDDLAAYLAENGLQLVDDSLQWRGNRAWVEVVYGTDRHRGSRCPRRTEMAGD